MKIKNDKFEIKEVESEHLIAIAKFLCNENHGVYTEEEWLEKFDLFWELNPWFDKKKHCRGWAIFNYNQEVHGFLGNIPIVYLKDGKSEEAFWGTTWVVSKHARGQSLKLYNKFIEQKGSLFSTSTEPKIKEVITYLFGYDELRPTWLNYKYTLPLSLVSSFRFVSYYYKNFWIKRNIFKLGNIFYKLLSLMYIAFSKLSKSGVKVNQCISVPNDIELFNKKFVSKYNYVLPRNKENIEWLYFSGEQSSLRLLLEVRDGSELIGLVSFKCILSEGGARLELLDFALLYVTFNIIQSVITQTQEISKKWRNDLAYVTFFSFDEIMDSELTKSGFHKMKSEDSFFIRAIPLHAEIPSFYTSPIDGDRSFFP